MKRGRIERKLKNDKPEKALQLARKARAKYQNKPKKSEVFEELYVRSLYESILVNPTIPRLQYFLNTHPNAHQKLEVETLLYELSLNDARKSGLESQLIGLMNEHKESPYAENIFSEAEKVAFENIHNTSASIQSFLFRFPNGHYQSQAKKLLADLAYSEAQQANTVSDWSDFLRRFPNHEHQQEAAKMLRTAAWNHMHQGEISAQDLWNYAHKFPETIEGWNAATQALTEKTIIHIHSSDMNFPLKDGSLIKYPIEKVVYDIGSALPTGYALDAHIDVKIEDNWTKWTSALDEAGEKLHTIVTSNEREVKHLQKNIGDWMTEYPVCSWKETPLPTRFCITMQQGDNQSEHCTELMVDSPCNGPEELLFLTLEDDILGPVAHRVYNSSEEQYQWRSTSAVIDERWHCSHIHNIGLSGADAICGKAILRIGWNGGVWIKPISDDIKKVERIQGKPWNDENGGPWRLKKGKLTSKTKSFGTINLNGRTPMWFKTPPKHSFNGQINNTYQVPPIPVEKERPQHMTILPIDAEPIEVKDKFGIHEESTDLIKLFDELYETQTVDVRSFEASFQQNSTVKVHITETENGYFAIFRNIYDLDQWTQIIILPNLPLSSWNVFQWSENTYLRGISSVSSNTWELYTIRWNGDAFTMDTETLRH